MLSNDPVFVVGVFRSGTSLLCSILNQNPRIALMFECDVWNFPRPLLNLRFQHNWAERIEFYNQALSRHQMVKTHDFSVLEKIRVPLDLYHTFGDAKGAAVSGEKSPFYCDRLVQLHKKYPRAAFIIVWRNPAEVYRSVLKAGKTSRFFGKPGMLSRMIYHQEQAIRQAAEIEKRGARLFRVDYAALVDQTEKACRDISAFLGVPFDDRMLHLNSADLSAIYKAPHHAYLRRGVIERQKYEKELVTPSVIQKLARYRCRWETMQAAWLKPSGGGLAKPGALEFYYHNYMGRTLTFYDSLVRAGFEFLPLPWLRVYRLLKNWVINPPSGAVDEKTSMLKDLTKHWPTVLTASLMMAGVIFAHTHSNPHLMFLLFYAAPCALLALVVNTRWATLFVVIASVTAPIVQYDADSDYHSTLVFMWNGISRFILMELLILMLGRIRLDFHSSDPHVK
ncbi:MAG TPA: sulfotransferase [Verrucomicrobiae bacterium]|nr:sulfotransferase [Verrucomicrobiae bacterium]